MDARPVTAGPPPTELFAGDFTQGAGYNNWRPHGSGDWLLIYTEAGAGRLGLAGGTHDTRPGEAVLYAPGEPQDYGTSPAAGHWHLLWVHFTPKAHWQPLLRWPVTGQGGRLALLAGGEVREKFCAALRRSNALAHRKLPGALDLAANALEEALLWAQINASQDPWLALDPRVRRAVDHLAAHPRAPFSLADLARHAGASVSRLAALFKQEIGTSPQQFFERHRLQRACQLLRLTDLSIADVAGEVGYADPFYFSNRFRRFEKTSPSQYRRRQRQTRPGSTRAEPATQPDRQQAERHGSEDVQPRQPDRSAPREVERLQAER